MLSGCRLAHMLKCCAPSRGGDPSLGLKGPRRLVVFHSDSKRSNHGRFNIFVIFTASFKSGQKICGAFTFNPTLTSNKTLTSWNFDCCQRYNVHSHNKAVSV